MVDLTSFLCVLLFRDPPANLAIRTKEGNNEPSLLEAAQPGDNNILEGQLLLPFVHVRFSENSGIQFAERGSAVPFVRNSSAALD
jgi:hypothetical protein